MSKNHWRREHGSGDFGWYECKAELLKHYSEDKIVTKGQGFIVNNTYLVSPHKKWRRLNTSTWYFYKTIDDLVTRYLKREKHENNKQIQPTQAI